MILQLYNTASKRIENFTAKDEQIVRIYTCGPTVYDYPHIGNWVAYIYWDTLIRVLRADGFTPQRVMNITDVGHLVSDGDEGEDKLEKGARREGKNAWDVAKFYTEDFMRGMDRLGLISPDHIAPATDFISEQIALIRTLKSKGYTYQISDGIYFDTAKFPVYGDFARLNTEELKAGARVEYNPEKRNASDFAVWKFTPAGVTRDMEWATPVDLLDDTSTPVKGFPGWHLECSAIAMKLLGNTLDIHTGGIDHIPVHHTNEIAQSEAATGQTFSRYWLHNNHMKVDGAKISKSLGNGYTLKDLEEKGYSPLDFRLLVLQSQYQNEANFSFEALQAAKNRRLHWRAVAALRWQASNLAPTTTYLDDAATAVLDALNLNLNTPEALRIVDETFARLEAQPLSELSAETLTNFITTLDELLGLQLTDSTPDLSEDTKALIQERLSARGSKNWAESDRIREVLLRRGIQINDTPDGSIWSYSN
jgi:cysteinyl-tRNA synthetase